MGEGIKDGRRAFSSGAGLVGLVMVGEDFEGGVSIDSICEGDSLPLDPCSLRPSPPPPPVAERGPLSVRAPPPVARSLGRNVLSLRVSLLRVSFC